MSRYLTPSKICLLILINMYCDGFVPSDCTMVVLSFITDQLLPETTRRERRQAKVTEAIGPTIEDYSKVLSPLKARMAMEPGSGLWQEFLRVSWKLTDLDQLFNFFQSLPQLFMIRRHEPQERQVEIPQVVLGPKSLFGAFIRRSRVEFERLPFQDAMALWHNYDHFRTPAKPAGAVDPIIEEFGLEAPATFYETMDSSCTSEGSVRGKLSSFDMERLLTFQVEKMQSMCQY